jgi:hypothetical protein
MSTASIFKVSESMLAEGFEYSAMFTGSTPLGPYHVKTASMWRPEGCVFLAKTSPSYTDDSEDDEPVVASEWNSWVRYEGIGLHKYPYRHLMFAKFDPTLVVENADPRFARNGPFRRDIINISNPNKSHLTGISIPNWSRLTTSFCGIHIDPHLNYNREVFWNWEVDTVAIWNAYAFTDIRVFRNSGAPWTYEV